MSNEVFKSFCHPTSNKITAKSFNGNDFDLEWKFAFYTIFRFKRKKKIPAVSNVSSFLSQLASTLTLSTKSFTYLYTLVSRDVLGNLEQFTFVSRTFKATLASETFSIACVEIAGGKLLFPSNIGETLIPP